MVKDGFAIGERILRWRRGAREDVVSTSREKGRTVSIVSARGVRAMGRARATRVHTARMKMSFPKEGFDSNRRLTARRSLVRAQER
tara:strand:+ start:18003 stop:18260 length:258 start_codon:yes stop_codon:yes gene_type:complete